MATAITCACGKVRMETIGEPLLSTICHCTSCRTTGRAFDARSGLPPVVDESGGTAVVLWRKDQVRCVLGAENLAPHRLKVNSLTRRFTASCCQTPLLMDPEKVFWVAIYRDRVRNAPPPAMRVMTGDTPTGVTLPNDGLPHLKSYSGMFMLKLLGTWISMGFRRPKVAGVPN